MRAKAVPAPNKNSKGTCPPVEKRILELELRQKELTGFLEQPDQGQRSLHPAQTGRELTTLAQELESLSLEWERLVDIAQNI